MTKEELSSYMRISREINTYDTQSLAWKRAFQLARQNGMESMEEGCTTCIKKIVEWLTGL